jgi:hypothetical protein
VSATFDVLLGSGIALVGTIVGGGMANAGAARSREVERRYDTYLSWIRQASEACRLATAASANSDPTAWVDAEAALDALVPYTIAVSVFSGAPKEMRDAVDQFGLLIKQVRNGEAASTMLRPALAAIATDIEGEWHSAGRMRRVRRLLDRLRPRVARSRAT